MSTPNWHVGVDRGGAQDYLVEKGMYDAAAAKPSSQKEPTHTTHELPIRAFSFQSHDQRVAACTMRKNVYKCFKSQCKNKMYTFFRI